MAENSGDLSLGYMMGQSEGNGGGGFGNFGEGIWAVIILAILFGRGGLGGFGGYGGGGDGVSAGFAWQGIDNGIRGIQQGLCDGFYAVNTGMLNGFHGVDNAICNLGFNTQQSINSLSHQLSDCCCTTQRSIDGINYNMAKGFCDMGTVISTSTRDITDTIRDGFSQMEARENARYIADLERKLNNCDRDSALQGLGTYLINTLRPAPTPAYITCNPWAASYGYGGYGNTGCGCGC